MIVIILRILIFVLFIGYASIANTEGFWCRYRLVNLGDTKIEVIAKCGDPDGSEIVSYDTTGYNIKGYISVSTKKVEILYYNCGDGRFIRILTFIDGRLVDIENGGYGSGPQKCD